LPLGKLWYAQAGAAIGYTKFFSRSDNAVIRVYDEAGSVIERTNTRAIFKEP